MSDERETLWSNDRINEYINDILSSWPVQTPRGLLRRVSYAVRDEYEAALTVAQRQVIEPELGIDIPHARQLLARLLGLLLSEYSERKFRATWYKDCEHLIWAEIFDCDTSHCLLEYPDEMDELAYISKAIYGWVYWSDEEDGPVYLSMSEWLDKHAEWERQRNNGN